MAFMLDFQPYGYHNHGQVVNEARRLLGDHHEHWSQNDMNIIGPIHPSGQPHTHEGDEPWPRSSDLSPEDEIRVVPGCVTNNSWYMGYIQVGSLEDEEEGWEYCIEYRSYFMVETFALEIMVLATQGRMTPLRLWRLAMKQGFEMEDHPRCLEGVDYGGVEDIIVDDFPEPFQGMTKEMWQELEGIEVVEVVKQKLVHEGKFWIWMAPDRFPVLPSEHDIDPPAPTFPEIGSSKNYAKLERLPMDILTLMFSRLPLKSLFNLASTSRFLRASVFGNEQLARTWIRTSAPAWIPVPTRTPRNDNDPPIVSPYLASELGPYADNAHYRLDATGLDWAYIRRCARSGSMRNRRRIWNTALDIERVADLSGV